jgi:hypothetical protein
MECHLFTRKFNSVFQHPAVLVNGLCCKRQSIAPTVHKHNEMLNLQDCLCKLNRALVCFSLQDLRQTD